MSAGPAAAPSPSRARLAAAGSSCTARRAHHATPRDPAGRSPAGDLPACVTMAWQACRTCRARTVRIALRAGSASPVTLA